MRRKTLFLFLLCFSFFSVHAQGLKIYPNPTSGWVHIQLPSGSPAVLSIRNVLGEVVHQRRTMGTKEITEQLDLSSGYYLVEVHSDGTTYFGRLIVQ